MRKFLGGAALGAGLLAASSGLPAHADGSGGYGGNGIRRVLLISIDGMHALDFINCAQGISGVNGGNPYCPNLADLADAGVNYLEAAASQPSDSFPGLMALVAGGSPRTVGAFYDVAYDRVLARPAKTTGSGVAAGQCTPKTPNGTRTEYEEGIDKDQSKLDGGANDGSGGGITSIDKDRLIRDPFNGCKPVYPWNFVRTNTIFGIVHQAGGYTAWSDKHPSYSSVAGPGDGTNVDDYYSPEINSNVVPLPGVPGCTSVPDPTNTGSWTDSFDNIKCYDTLKVQAILNEINGRDHTGAVKRPVPTLFGMNFQVVSVGQNLIEKSIGRKGGYLDNEGRPSDELLGEIQFADTSIGKMVVALKSRGLYQSTLIVISAKHGQSPIDSKRYLGIGGAVGQPDHDLAGGDPRRSPPAVRAAVSARQPDGRSPADRADRRRHLTALAVGFLTDHECRANVGKHFAGDEQHRRNWRDLLWAWDCAAVQPAGVAAKRRPAHARHHRPAEHRRHLFGKHQETRRARRLRA